MDEDKRATGGFSRRNFLSASATGAALPLVADILGGRVEASAATLPTSALVTVALTINGQRRSLSLDPRTTLLDALRDHVGLTGSKKGCDHGQCGACTVHVNGQGVNACLTLAVAAQGKSITTIEGLAGRDGDLHPLQQAFVDHDAFQCGYCTSGQIMSGLACITSGHATSEPAIREYMSGNLCRCAAYPNIVRAIVDAKTKMGA